MDEIGNSNETVKYATLLDYSPRGITPGSILSRRLIRNAVKNVQEGILDQASSTLSESAIPGMHRFFRGGVILVPVPRCHPHRDFMPWPSLAICRALERAGIVNSVWPGLRRTQAVQRSCRSGPRNRPDPGEHSGSLSVIGSVKNPQEFLLVDDFVTRGSTLVSCAAVLREAFPKAAVRAFALVNTLGPGEEVMNILNPRFGEIRYQGGRLDRSSWAEKVSVLQDEEVRSDQALSR